MTSSLNRVLPIHWAPLPGEALESWLAAFAVRLEVTWGELLDAVLPVPPGGKREPKPGSLSAVLRADEVTSIAAATGIVPSAVLAMTLEGSRNCALQADVVSRHVATPWGQIYRQRFCPRCLSQTSGRWSLQWRLPWVTVCPRHRCFLHDRCRACGRECDIRSGWFNAYRLPQPEQCRCTEHLGATPADVLPAHHPVLLMQRKLVDLLTRPSTQVGVYRSLPVSSAQLLADVRILALRILGTATPQTLTTALRSTGASDEPDYWADRLDTTVAGHVRWSMAASAPVVAAGVTAALSVLVQPSLEAAAAALQVVAAADKSHQIRPSRTKLGFTPSPALNAVEVLSRADHFGPVDTLRYCLPSSRPRYPVTARDRVADSLARAVPTLFWPDWALVLPVIPKTRGWVTKRQILSWLLLETGDCRTERLMLRELRFTILRQQVLDAARVMSRQPAWPATAAVLVRLHDYLAAHPPPIDYQRRRTLDYSDLLPPERWQTVCQRVNFTSRSTQLHSVVRAWLFERVSAIPAKAHTVRISATTRTELRDRFLRSLTPIQLGEIDCVAMEFLAENGITDEPIVWSPPRGIGGKHIIAGRLGESVPDRELGSLLNADGVTLPEAARRLGVPVEAVRYRLAQGTVPARRPVTQTHLARAQQMLSEAHLRRLYLDEGRSLTEIARQFDIPRTSYVSQLANAYGIPLRSKPRGPIPADWIHTHHVTRRRTVGEMAAAFGESEWRIRYWARMHGIALQTYYRREPYIEVQRVARRFKTYPLLSPAISDKAGWKRLQRFAFVAQYRNFGDAANALGCRPQTLSKHILLLESSFGQQLVQRAPSRSEPMKLCEFGQLVVAATRQIQRALDREHDTRRGGDPKRRTA